MDLHPTHVPCVVKIVVTAATAITLGEPAVSKLNMSVWGQWCPYLNLYPITILKRLTSSSVCSGALCHSFKIAKPPALVLQNGRPTHKC
jgi:hypothetical protein